MDVARHGFRIVAPRISVLPVDTISASLLLDDSRLFDSDDNVVDSGSRVDISSLLLVLLVELHAARKAAAIMAAVAVIFRTSLFFIKPPRDES